MLKVTRHLFSWYGDAKYADYYEQALYNHILGQQDPKTGMVCYFTPMKPGAYRLYSTPDQSFWCCVGSGFESHSKYGEGIYYHDDKGVYINLFIPSELNWKEKSIKLRQETKFPAEETTTLTIESVNTVNMPLYIRYPSWATSEGKQVGYRHLGDIDLLYFANGEPPFNDRFFYVTIPIPLQHTKRKNLVNLEIRSYGEIWGYGETFKRYQKNMVSPTLGFYKGYTHTSPMFVPDKNEVQGKYNPAPRVRTVPGEEVLVQLKERVNKEPLQILESNKPPNQQEIMFLAPAYSVKWAAAYKNELVVNKIIESINEHYRKYLDNPRIIYDDRNVYNWEWLVTGPIARSIRGLWNELNPILDDTFNDGKGNKISHREAWSVLMQESLKYSTTHRRHYTNQSMIIDMFMYDCNRALLLLDPVNALPEYQTLRYLYESVGLAPWLGKETSNGPEKNLGENYWQLTDKGLTKELGFVGYYGEVLDWVVDIYKSTSLPGVPNSGDPKIKEQLLKMMMARSYFRYAVNKLAKVHYITPTIDRIANIYIHSEFDSSGMKYTRQNWVNLGFSGSREFYPGIESAHAGEVLAIAKILDGVSFKPGDENVYAGKANFYQMQYGNYLIGMNSTKVKTFELEIPADFTNALNLSSKEKIGNSKTIKVAPQTTVVLFAAK